MSEPRPAVPFRVGRGRARAGRLHWADRPALEPVGLAQLLGRLAASRYLRQLPSDPTRILSLASRPAWDLRRPRDWAALPDAVDGLLRAAQRAVEPRVANR